MKTGLIACAVAALFAPAAGCGDDDDTGDADVAGDADIAESLDADDGTDAGDVPDEETTGDGDAGDADGEDGTAEWLVEAVPARLPTGLGGTTAVAVDGVAYVFGGVNGPPPTNVVDTILRYDPALDAVETLSVRLPQRVFLTAAAWNGTHAYLFGGFADTALTGAVLRFDPAVPEVTTMGGTLPEPIARTAAAEDGSVVYVLGGNTGGFMPSGFVSTITRYDPGTDTTAPTAASLPSGRASRIGAIRCAGRILFLGGWGPTGKLDEILEYLPATDSIAALETRLPRRLDGGALACDGTRVYLFGGESETAILDDIVVFDTTDDSVAVAPVALPTPRKGHAAVWIGDSAYVFGGQQTSSLTTEILRVTPP